MLKDDIKTEATFLLRSNKNTLYYWSCILLYLKCILYNAQWGILLRIRLAEDYKVLHFAPFRWT